MNKVFLVMNKKIIFSLFASLIVLSGCKISEIEEKLLLKIEASLSKEPLKASATVDEKFNLNEDVVVHDFFDMRGWNYRKLDLGNTTIDVFENKKSSEVFRYSWTPIKKEIHFRYDNSAKLTEGSTASYMGDEFKKDLPFASYSVYSMVINGEVVKKGSGFNLPGLNLKDEVLVITVDGIESNLPVYEFSSEIYTPNLPSRNKTKWSLNKIYEDPQNGFNNLKRTKSMRFLSKEGLDLTIGFEDFNRVKETSMEQIWSLFKEHPDYKKDFDTRKGDFKYNKL